MKTVAIVNPAAGNRKAVRLWPKLLENLGPRAVSVTTWWTQGPGHGEILAARARRQGFERVVAVGGDGTMFEVANGLWWEPQGQLPSLGIVPLGTSCDYVKNFSLGRSPMDWLVQALEEVTIPVHVGVLQVQAITGGLHTRICLNVLGLGFDAKVVERKGQRQFPLAGKAPYLVSGLQELLALRFHHLSGRLDGKPFAARSSLLVAWLGQYFGGGMKITPLASPESGRFHVVWDEGLGRLALLLLACRTFAGTHISHYRVRSCLAQTLEVTADPPALMEVEGELAGRTPLKAYISPNYLHIAVPAGSLENHD